MNAAQVTGFIIDIQDAGKSKVVTIQYGPRREDSPTGTAAENMVSVRLPKGLLSGPHSDEIASLEPGDWVEVYARVQGVLHRRVGKERLATEVVVSRITKPEFMDFGDGDVKDGSPRNTSSEQKKAVEA